MTSKDVKVEIKDNYVTLSGQRKEEHREETPNGKSYRLERSFGKFSRSFRLPTNADAGNIRASCEHGVLKVILPKLAPPATSTVSINVADTHQWDAHAIVFSSLALHAI